MVYIVSNNASNRVKAFNLLGYEADLDENIDSYDDTDEESEVENVWS